MPLSIPPTPRYYGPTPLHVDQGEQAFFSFGVAGDPGVSYTSVIASVQIYDGYGHVVRTLQTPVTLGADGTAPVKLVWDGKDDAENPLPPGDYAPTFRVTGVRNG